MRVFEYDDGVSQKFWEVQRDGGRVTVRYGRLGTQGRDNVKDLGSDAAAERHLERMVAEKLKKGYVERTAADSETTRPTPAARQVPAGGITVERGMKKYMREGGGACRLLVRKADDVEAATAGLQAFRDDLWTSDLFAALDGEFGDDVEGKPLRYTPSFASEVELGPEGPELWFDADDTFDTWPELIGDVLQQLTVRLHEAGVRRAEIGRPKPPYAERAYVPDADWHMEGRRLEPLDETWLPPSFPDGFPVPLKAPVVVAHRARDETWTGVAWRRREAEDAFEDAIARWREYGLTIKPMTAAPPGPPDISWGWRQVHRAFFLEGHGSHGWAWTVLSRSAPATDLHVVWFDPDRRGRTEKLRDAAGNVSSILGRAVSELRPPRRSR